MPDNMASSALNEPMTQQAWKKARHRATAVLSLWFLSVPGLYIVATIIWEKFWGPFPDYLSPVLVVISLSGIVISQTRWQRTKPMRRVLQVYPWQRCTQVGHVHNGIAHFRLPDPDSPGKSVNITFRRLDNRRWRCAVLSNKAQEIWFAGDPRFTTVVALPGPRKLTLVQERDVLGYGTAKPPRGVSHHAWEQALAASQAGD